MGVPYTEGDLQAVREHLGSLPDDALDYPPNAAMLERIQEAMSNGQALTYAENNFMAHELTEAALMAEGMSQDEAHDIAMLEHPNFANYDPEVVQQFPELFNSNWFAFWDIP